MHKETFYLDGENAAAYGINLQRPLQFSGAVPVVESVHVPGRNGNLIFSTGAYENRTATASCFALSYMDAERFVSAACGFLLRSHGYRRLETSDDPDHYRKARVANGAALELRLRSLAPYEIKFDCAPQRLLKSGGSTLRIDSPSYLFNPTDFPAMPRITVFGGPGTLRVGGYTAELREVDGFVVLDSETQNAYRDTENENGHVSIPEFPLLLPGRNDVTWSGEISRVEIIPRWWEL